MVNHEHTWEKEVVNHEGHFLTLFSSSVHLLGIQKAKAF